MTDTNQYAIALFSLAVEEGKAEKIGEELASLVALISEKPSYIKLIDTPALSLTERAALIDEALAPLDEYLKNTVKLLAERRLSYTLPSLLKKYSELLDEANGVLRAEAVSAVPMTDTQLSALKQKLERKTKKTVIIKNTVDKTTLGGLILRYAGLSEDGSLRHRLNTLEKSLTDAKI